MPIDKVVNLAPSTDIIEFDAGNDQDIEIIIEDDGSALIEIGMDDEQQDFYDILAGAAGGAIGLSALRGLQSDEQERKPD